MSSFFVALESFKGHDPDGDPVDVKAGVTRVSSDWVGLRDPRIARRFAPIGSAAGARVLEEATRARFSPLPERSDSGRSWVLPAGTTVVSGELPKLRATAIPTVTVTLRSSVWHDLQDHVREASDGRETAGFLFGAVVRSWRPVSVGWVTSMVVERRESSCVLDIAALVTEKGRLRRSGLGDVGEQGSWHTHPARFGETHVGRPSETDLAAWLNAHDFLERAFYVGLILTAGLSDERWSNPKVHGWVVRRLEHTNTAVCEPAIVKTGRG
jgi:hypothetical protein